MGNRVSKRADSIFGVKMKAGFYLSPNGERIVYINAAVGWHVVEGVFIGAHYISPYQTFILQKKEVKHFYGKWERLK